VYIVQTNIFWTEFISPLQHCLLISVFLFKVLFLVFYTDSTVVAPPFVALCEVHCLKTPINAILSSEERKKSHIAKAVE
jgi:hypothetical protein